MNLSPTYSASIRKFIDTIQEIILEIILLQCKFVLNKFP